MQTDPMLIAQDVEDESLCALLESCVKFLQFAVSFSEFDTQFLFGIGICRRLRLGFQPCDVLLQGRSSSCLAAARRASDNRAAADS